MSITALILIIGILLCIRAGAAPTVDLPSLSQQLMCMRLGPIAQITASGDSLATVKAPCNGRIVLVKAGCHAIGGDVAPTDVDVDPEKGTTDLCNPLAAADSSAVVSGGSESAPDAGVEDFEAGDVFHLDVDITAGTNPTVTGAWAEIWYVRKPD